MNDLVSMFNNAKHVRYCILDDYTCLPANFPSGPLRILTENAEALISLWCLAKVGGRRYSCEVGQGEQKHRLEVELFLKGKGTFPDRFESLLLTRAVTYNHCVKVPSSDLLPYMRLYWILFYDNILPGTFDRKVLIEHVSEHVGAPMTPKDKSLKVYRR